MKRHAALLARLTVRLAAIPLSLLACESAATGPGNGLETARTRWASRAPAAYTITILRSCECLPETSGPVEVSVRDGVVIARRYVATGAAVAPPYAAVFPAVEGLFGLIEAAVRVGTRPLNARYDATLGYPTRIVVGDPYVDAPVYSVTNFRAE